LKVGVQEQPESANHKTPDNPHYAPLSLGQPKHLLNAHDSARNNRRPAASIGRCFAQFLDNLGAVLPVRGVDKTKPAGGGRIVGGMDIFLAVLFGKFLLLGMLLIAWPIKRAVQRMRDCWLKRVLLINWR
jgi:hypothetical protein